MKSLVLQNDGKTEEREVGKSELLRRYSFLNIRDLRPVFSPLQVATILPRSEVLVVNLGFVKAIIGKDIVHFLFASSDEKTNKFLKKLIDDIKGGENFGSRLFYLLVLEKILESKTDQLNKKVETLKTRAENVLKQITKHFSKETLEKLLALKKKISRLEIRVKEIQSAIDEILDDEESFDQLVQIGGGSDDARLEAESVLENTVEQVEDNLGNVLRISEDIEDTEEYLSLRVDHFRNKIIKIDLAVSTVTLVFAVLAVVVGLYGMNIKNGFENSIEVFRTFQNWIIFVSVGAVALAVLLFNKRDLL